MDDDILSPILGRRAILRTAGAMGIMSLVLQRARRADLHSSPERIAEFSDLLDDPRMQAVCSMTPALIEGPYYLNLNLVRSDIRENIVGLTTNVVLHVVRASDCTPIPNATIDIWHASPVGHYSGFASEGTSGQTWLRGTQITDANGTVQFLTVYPGWYQGRTTHMHFKAHLPAGNVLTTQTYFKQRLSWRVYGLPQYVAHGQPTTINSNDGLYTSATEMSVLSATAAGLLLEFTIGVA